MFTHIRTLALALAVALAAMLGSATVANAAPVKPAVEHTYDAPAGRGCGPLLAITVKRSGKATFIREHCVRTVKGKSTGITRTFEAPERVRCGRLLQVLVTRDAAMFRYVACDRTVLHTGATE